MTQTKLGNKGSMATTFSRMCVRRDTAKNWHDPNVAKLPLEGEICLTIKGDPTDPDEKKWSHEWGQIKIGDGEKDWDELEYYGGGDAEVIVGPDDPAPGWPGGGPVPEGVLWFNTGNDTLLIRVSGDWTKISPDNELYFADSTNEPVSPINGDLWHVSDEGLLKIWDENAADGKGGWVPACAPPNQNGDAADMVRKSGDEMHGALKVHDDSKTGTAAVFKVDTSDNGSGGFIVKANGAVGVIGTSNAIDDDRQLTTKMYVDNTVSDATSDDKFVSKTQTADQIIYSRLFVKHRTQQPSTLNVDPEVRGAGSDAAASVYGHYYLSSPTLYFGNRGNFSDGTTPVPSDSQHFTHSKIELRDYAEVNKNPWKQEVIYDRLKAAYAYKTDIRKNSTADGVYVPKPSGRNEFEAYDQIHWNPDAEAPERCLNWLADPDDTAAWNRRIMKADSSPVSSRAATKGYVDRVMEENTLMKGSDLCADSEDDAQLGGFWRDGSGTVYLKVS